MLVLHFHRHPLDPQLVGNGPTVDAVVQPDVAVQVGRRFKSVFAGDAPAARIPVSSVSWSVAERLQTSLIPTISRTDRA